MVLQPDRILLERTVVVELEMIVIVISDALVLVGEIRAQGMVGERMAGAVGLVILVLGVRHQTLSSKQIPHRERPDRHSAGRTTHGNGLARNRRKGRMTAGRRPG